MIDQREIAKKNKRKEDPPGRDVEARNYMRKAMVSGPWALRRDPRGFAAAQHKITGNANQHRCSRANRPYLPVTDAARRLLSIALTVAVVLSARAFRTLRRSKQLQTQKTQTLS
jgi:hypothetical protein